MGKWNFENSKAPTSIHGGWSSNGIISPYIINAGEINDPDYLANPANRCYFCKTNLYDTVVSQTDHLVLSGANLDDLGDYRPGLDAAKEHQVKHPYVDAGIDKATLRAIAKHLSLTDLYDLPAAPCLASRIETGIAINPELLPVINETEQALWDRLQLSLPIKGIRCRLRKSGVAIELQTSEDIDTSADYVLEATKIVSDRFTSHGFAKYTAHITIEPYRRGSAFLVETLTVEWSRQQRWSNTGPRKRKPNRAGWSRFL